MAFVYQRLSTTEQKKNSRYSLERQEDLAQQAREDGYAENLIYVERRDLGISGTLGQEDREGLAYLIHLIERDRVESVYIIEISRISRDQTLINGLQFGELCKRHNVFIITPTMRLNLNEDMHMRMYRYEIDRAAEELKSIRFRLQGARNMKARHGYFVGPPLPVGYVIDTTQFLPSGEHNPNYLKFTPYEPHAEIVRQLFTQLAVPGATLKSVTLWGRKNGIVFSPLPADLLAVKGNASGFAHTKCDAEGNYPITTSRLHSMACNPAYIGWFIWSGEIISKSNHPPIVEEEIFWAVQRKFARKSGQRQTGNEPLILAGLLYCIRHVPSRRMIGNNNVKVGTKRYHCRNENEPQSCTNMYAHILDTPISELVISQCSFSEYTAQVLRNLTDQHHAELERAAANKREFQRITQEIENLKTNLARTRTPQQVDMLLQMIDDKVQEKKQLSLPENQPLGRVLSVTEVQTVSEFLQDLNSRWAKMTDQLKNMFLSLLLERIEIAPDANIIFARVIWRTGFHQDILIKRAHTGNRPGWTVDEDEILIDGYACLSQEELCAALPNRPWGAIKQRALTLGLQRPLNVRKRKNRNLTPFTAQEDEILRTYYAHQISLTECLMQLDNRTSDAVEWRARQLNLRKHKRKLQWHLLNDEETQATLARLNVAIESDSKTKLLPSRA